MPIGEYFQVHPYKSIEDGLPVGEYLLKMVCLLGEYFKFTLINLLKMGSMGEYFQVHPYKSIEDGLPIGEYFQLHP